MTVFAIIYVPLYNYKQAMVDQRLEIAQEYYRITYQWPRVRFDLATLGRISTELDMYNQGHALYLDSPSRAMANALLCAMRDVESLGEIPTSEAQKKIQRVSELIPRFQEVLLRSVWLEDTPREKEDLLVLGV